MWFCAMGPRGRGPRGRKRGGRRGPDPVAALTKKAHLDLDKTEDRPFTEAERRLYALPADHMYVVYKV